MFIRLWVCDVECYDLVVKPSEPQLASLGSNVRVTCHLVNYTSVDTALYDRPPMRWRAADMRYIDDVTGRCVPVLTNHVVSSCVAQW